MWVDQPAGVGFSTGLGTHDEAGVAKNMLYFLQGFYEQFPQYQSTDFYIFGESYAGHYVPAIAHKIWQSNKDGQGLHIPMAGIAIGNGLTNPQEQYKWYPEMGMTGGQSEGGHAPSGVINAAEGALMKSMVPGCILSIETCNKGFVDPTTGLVLNVTACMEAYDLCNLMSQIPYELTGKNPYDMRIPCGDSQLCYDFDRFTKWLNTASVQQELGVSKLWQSCNREVDLLFVSAGDWMLNYHTLIPDLLHDGLEVLIYAGDEDYICNWLGNRAWTQKLDWNSKDKFNAADENEWQLDGQVVAKHRAADHFHFMQVYEAGHMVPMDQPKVALEMVNAFVAGNLDSVVKSSQSVAV
jgi:cathepsin A (carboxypeptidase C)